MEFVPLVAALALALKILDLVKYAMARDINGVTTQVASWAAGIVVVFLLAATDFASGVQIADRSLSDLNAASLLLVGLSLASSGSVLYDFKKAIDHTDTAVTPSLLHREGVATRHAEPSKVNPPLT